MTPDLIFLPVLAQILLTIVIYGGLPAAKARAVKGGLVDEARRGFLRAADDSGSIRCFYMVCPLIRLVTRIS